MSTGGTLGFANVRNLSVTIMASVTGTLAMKHVTFVVHNRKSVQQQNMVMFVQKLCNNVSKQHSRLDRMNFKFLFTITKSLLGVRRVVFSLHVAFGTRRLWSWSRGGGGGVLVTRVFPGIPTSVATTAVTLALVALTTPLQRKLLLGGVFSVSYCTRFTLLVRGWGGGGWSRTYVCSRAGTLVGTITETLTSVPIAA